MNERIEAAEEYVAGINRYRDRCAVASSERALSESASPAKVVAAVATCSLPASSVQRLREKWHNRAIHANDVANNLYQIGDYRTAGEFRAEAARWDKAAEELRAEMEAAMMRQPEENTKDEPRR